MGKVIGRNGSVAKAMRTLLKVVRHARARPSRWRSSDQGPSTMTDRSSDAVEAGGSRLVVGLVRALHGLRGAVRVEILSDDPARFEPGSVLFLEGTDDRLTVAESQSDGPGLLLRFRERHDRESVEDLRDRYLEAVAPAEPLPEGSFYWHELTGLRVVDQAGADLGHVVDVFRAGGAEVLVVEGARGELIDPAVEHRGARAGARRGTGRGGRRGTWRSTRASPARGCAGAARRGHARRRNGGRETHRRPPPSQTPLTRTPPIRPDAPHRRHHALPRGCSPDRSRRASPVERSHRERRPSRRTTCGDGASAGTGASTTTRMAAAPGCSCGPSPWPRRSTRSRPPGSAATRILLDPGGMRLDHARARELASAEHLVLVCPRYEGIDDRVRRLVDLELSIGDYILSGGENPGAGRHRCCAPPAAGCHRRGVAEDESFADGLLEYPQYTRPAEFRGMAVPDVLLSGHHGEVARWRRARRSSGPGGCGRTCSPPGDSTARTGRAAAAARPDILRGRPIRTCALARRVCAAGTHNE